MMNKNLTIRCLALMVMMILFSTAVAYADSIWLGGKDIYVSSGVSYWLQSASGLTKENASEQAYNVKYDKANNKLTLKNVNLSGGKTFGIGSNVPLDGSPITLYIDVNAPITIALEGENTLGSSSTGTAIYAHMNVSALTFEDGPASGIGSLEVIAQRYGIYYRGSNGVSGYNLNINGGNITIDANANGSGTDVDGILLRYADNVVMNGGNVEIHSYSAGSQTANGVTCAAFEMNDGSFSVYSKSNASEGYGIKTDLSPSNETLKYTGGYLLACAEDSGSYDYTHYNKAFNAFFTQDSVQTMKSKTGIWVDNTNGLGTSKYFWSSPIHFQEVTSGTGKYAYIEIKERCNVVYTDGVAEEIFEDQIDQAYWGDNTPAFTGNLTREGYRFVGWKSSVTGTVSTTVPEEVTGDVTYTAQWEELPTYTVTYTDGVEGEEIFPDEVNTGLLADDNTPAFTGDLTREGYGFAGWKSSVTDTVSTTVPEKVTGDVTYTAQWEELPTYTVTYTDGVDGETVFENKVFAGLYEGDDTPAFNGEPKRAGYIFAGWSPAVAQKVAGNATYTAQWTADPTQLPIDGTLPPDLPQTGDHSRMGLWFAMIGMAGAVLVLLRRRAYHH